MQDSPIVSTAFSVSGGSSVALPVPDLSGLPDYVSIDDTLMIRYPPGYDAVAFDWTFTSVPGGASGPVPHSASWATSGHAQPTNFQTNFQTAGRIAMLANRGLEPGVYTVTVQAYDASNHRSPMAEKTVALVAGDLSSVRVYPNPWRVDKYSIPQVTFDRLPLGSIVKIFTLSGRFVKRLTAPAETALWDLTNDAGDTVASGLYIYVVTDSKGNRTRGKLTLIK
jgi:hypothetical protein